MRILLVVLLSLPRLITAGCGCEEVEKELERERKADADYHACRSCKAIVPSAAACPFRGYECNPNWPLTANTITANNNCQCLEARCAGKAKLAFDGDIVGKMRCNNTKWMVGEEIADNVVCAKSCDKGICKEFHPKASADFTRLQVQPATVETTCATGDCAHGFAVLNADGSLLKHLDSSVLSVSCSADGNWFYEDGEKSKYVMCNASPCGPTKCPWSVPGVGMDSGEVFALNVTANGKQCATAKCPDGFAEMNAKGEVVGGIPETAELVCNNDGKWETKDKTKRYDFAMCRQPGCGVIKPWNLTACGTFLATIGNDNGCTEATRTATTTECTTGQHTQLIFNGDDNSPTSQESVFCDETTRKWTISGTTDALYNHVLPPVQVACMKP